MVERHVKQLFELLDIFIQFVKLGGVVVDDFFIFIVIVFIKRFFPGDGGSRNASCQYRMVVLHGRSPIHQRKAYRL